LAGELDRHRRIDFLVRIDREQVDVRDVAAQRMDLVLLHERVQLARLVAVDREVDDRVLLADRVERGAQRLDVDGDRQRLDAAIGRRAVANSGNLALRAQRTSASLTGAGTKTDSELSNVRWRGRGHDDSSRRSQTNRLEIESP